MCVITKCCLPTLLVLYLQSKHRKSRPFYGTLDLIFLSVRDATNMVLKFGLGKMFLESDQCALGGSANVDSNGRTRETDDGPA